MTIRDLYELNDNGKGFRSIGKWEIIENIDDLSNYELNEPQYKHADKILDRHGYFIIMKEAYSDKYRIHDTYSFCFFFMCNIAGALIYNNLNEQEEKYYQCCYEILDKAKFFI